MENKEEIKAPILMLEQWREINVPSNVWENPYLQAYLKARQKLVRLGIGLLAIVAFLSGTMFR